VGKYVLAIDQGTTSSRAIIYDANQSIAGIGQQEFPQYYPKPGWVEHDPEEIWKSVLATCKSALKKAGLKPQDLAAIGITNQRETTIVWDRKTGKPIYNAIVWQDRRTAETCARLKAGGHEKAVNSKTGLLLDPYFSGTKAAWILDTVKGARKRADAGKLAFGTIDSFLIWRLTGGARHVTDATNASRTLMYNIKTNTWDPGCSSSCVCRRTCCLTCWIVRLILAPPARPYLGPRSRSWAWLATSRQRPSAMPASGRA
jgi:glycerol kinase